jgi:HD-GYP domain-containing protein (c-di-GMP phosphodiesterase class II)
MDPHERLTQLERELDNARREVGELNSLIKSMALVNSTLNLSDVLDSLMDLAKTITRSEAASVLLLEDDKLFFLSAAGEKHQEVKKVYLDKHEGVAGWVFEHQQPVLVNDVNTDPRFSSRADRTSGFQTRSLLAVPMTVDGTIVGVVEAVNKLASSGFADDDMRLLTALANSSAMAINKARFYTDLNDLFLSTIKAMANAIEAKDPYTRGHSERIRDFSLVIAAEMAFTDEQMKQTEVAALLHDVGKIGVSELVLQKQGRLTAEEFAEIKKHPGIGADMLSSIKQLKAEIPGIRHHQERFDGTGYPDGLAGDRIPIIARVIAVADTFDAMTSDRPYRRGLPDEVALTEIRDNASIQFDPACVDAFLRGYDKGLIKSLRTHVTE